jgi:autotransporter-associated beta strand protein
MILAATFTTAAIAQFSWSGTQTLSNGTTISQDVILTGDVTLNVPSGTAIISGTISGSYNVTKTGSGTLIYTSTNSYMGTTTISAGTLQFGNGGNGMNASGKNISIASGAILRIDKNSNATLSGVISGAGNLYKYGTGILTLSGTNTYTGVTSVYGGTLRIGGSSTSSGATGQVVSNIFVGPNGTLEFNRSNGCTYGSVISGTGNVKHIGTGELSLSGTNTYTGKTTVSEAKLTIPSGGSLTGTNEIELTNAAACIAFNNSTNRTYNCPITGAGWIEKASGSGSLTLGSAQYMGKTTITAGSIEFEGTSNIPTSAIQTQSGTGVIFDVLSGGTVQYSGIVSGAGYLYMYGTGKLILSAANTYTGATLVASGTLQINGSINSTSGITLSSSSAVIRFEPASITTFSKIISGSGKLVKGGNMDVRLTANNTYTGGTTIEAGYLVLGYNTKTGIVAGNISIASGANLRFRRTDTLTYSGVISGAGNVSVYGTSGVGKIILGGVNTYTGATEINGGTLALNATGKIESSSGVTLSNATAKFDISATDKTIKTLNSTFPAAAVILGSRILYIGTDQYSNDGGGSYAGIFTGTGGFSKFGTQTLTLTGTSTHTGINYIQYGTVTFSSAQNFGAGQTNNVYIVDGTLQWERQNTTDMSSRIYFSGGTPTLDIQGNNVTFSTALTGSSLSLHKKGLGTLSTIAANTFTGTLYIDAGEWKLTGTNGSLTVPSIVTATNTKFQYEKNASFTYSGVISGTGSVEVLDGKLILTGNNTYTGGTLISGTQIPASLQIGNNGTTGSITGNVTLNASDCKLIFSRSNAYTFAGIISGGGSVEKAANGTLTLSGANTYTDTTIISAGTLAVSTTGSIGSTLGVFITGANAQLSLAKSETITTLNSAITTSGVVISSGTLTVNNGSFAGVISGAGGLTKGGTNLAIGSGTVLTLNNTNTYTGITAIAGGTLTLGANGTIANSADVQLGYTAVLAYGKLDISAGNKTIKNLSAANNSNEVILGANSLTIGTSAVIADGGGDFKGKFTGTGGVAKTGLLEFDMSGQNTATGTFSHSAGTIGLSSVWAGHYYQAASTTLDITGNVTIGGSLTLAGGGNIAMDLTASTPAKINVTVAVSASGNTTLNITAPAGTHTLIQAASGLSFSSPFTLNMPGFTSSLAATGTQLNLTATITDVTAPTIGTGAGITAGTTTANSVALSWVAASDDQTLAANLRYFVYQSTSNNMASVSNCEANGTLLNSGGTINMTSYPVTGLTPNTVYYFNVIVSDQAGNKAVYTTATKTTSKAVLTGTVTISGNSVFGQTLTAGTSLLTSSPSIASIGTLTYQWKRGSTNIGTNASTYTLVQGDIGQTISVTVKAANCNDSITSQATATVIKASQNAPSAPALASKTHNSITLTAITGAEYVEGYITGTWQTSTTFSGLQPETAYSFYARLAETATHDASPASNIATFTTDTLPIPDKVLISIQQLTAITGLSNGTPKTIAGLTLPANVTMVTDQGNISATVTWNVAACSYNPALTTAQTFSVNGTATLPSGVVNPNAVSLTISISITVNAVPLNPQVSNVIVSPATANVQKGTTQQFYETVTAIDGADPSVTWSINGQSSINTVISSAGLLSVDLNESATTITVKATSVFDIQKYGTATVTITNVPVQPEVVSVTVSPDLVDVQKGNTENFFANVQIISSANQDVTWSIQGQTSVTTTIDNYGTLTIASDETADTITVIATSDFDPLKFGTAKVAVTDIPVLPEIINIAISPFDVEVEKGNSEQFYATVMAIGGASQDVTWSIQGQTSALTTIDNYGLLTLASDEMADTITVIATSVFDIAKYGITNVIVKNKSISPQVTGVTVNPASIVVQKGNAQQFYATVTVTGGASQDVTWSIQGQTSALTIIDGYGMFTVASDETTDTITVIATSVFDIAKFGMAKVIISNNPVSPQIISVSVTPSEVEIMQGSVIGFTATIVAIGGADESVTWSISGNTSAATQINTSGSLTVATDESAQEIMVMATSVFNPNIKGNAKVKIKTVGVVNLSLTGISVYPNPFKEFIRIDNAENAMVKIVDMNGKILGIYNNISNSETIAISHLSAGEYIILIGKENKNVSIKVIKE